MDDSGPKGDVDFRDPGPDRAEVLTGPGLEYPSEDSLCTSLTVKVQTHRLANNHRLYSSDLKKETFHAILSRYREH